MKYILDTNIISEMTRPQPDFNALCWVQDHCDDVYMTSVAVKELYYGILIMPEGRRKTVLRDRIDAIVRDCVDKTLPFDAFSGFLCAEMHAEMRRAGRGVTIEDCMIAAICKCHGCVLATHNMKDFEHFGIEVIDPFEYESPTLKRLKCEQGKE